MNKWRFGLRGWKRPVSCPYRMYLVVPVSSTGRRRVETLAASPLDSVQAEGVKVRGWPTSQDTLVIHEEMAKLLMDFCSVMSRLYLNLPMPTRHLLPVIFLPPRPTCPPDFLCMDVITPAANSFKNCVRGMPSPAKMEMLSVVRFLPWKMLSYEAQAFLRVVFSKTAYKMFLEGKNQSIPNDLSLFLIWTNKRH